MGIAYAIELIVWAVRFATGLLNTDVYISIVHDSLQFPIQIIQAIVFLNRFLLFFFLLFFYFLDLFLNFFFLDSLLDFLWLLFLFNFLFHFFNFFFLYGLLHRLFFLLNNRFFFLWSFFYLHLLAEVQIRLCCFGWDIVIRNLDQ